MLRNINLQNPSRGILKREGKLKIFLDTKCFDHILNKNDLAAIKLLDYLNT